jgi:carbon-monoxide dehydrogenase small subunit
VRRLHDGAGRRTGERLFLLALQAEGRDVTTVEGLAGDEEVGPLQRAFLQQAGVQCGFCTPGMLVSATTLLRHNPDPTEDEIRIALSGNLCRCTGYRGIVRAVRQVASGGVPPLAKAPVHADATPPHHAG